MLSFLYTLCIAPLEALYQSLYDFFVFLTGSYFWSLLCLSVFSVIIFTPLKRLANKAAEKEKKIHTILDPQLLKINEESSGAGRQARTKALYRRYAYHPVYALRSSFGIALQVPFLCAAYYMLRDHQGVKGQAVLFINDLSLPDGLLGGINILPLLMTAINIAAVYTTRSLGGRDRKQALVIAFMFLALLYEAPAALLIYWTFNNSITLLENFFPCVFLRCGKNENIALFIRKNVCLESSALSIFLLGITPILFLLSQNWYRYSNHSIILSLSIYFLLSFSVFIVICTIQTKITKITNNTLVSYVANIIFSLFFAYFIWKIYGSTILAGYALQDWPRRIVRTIIFIVLFLIVFRSKKKNINKFISLFIIICITYWAFDVSKTESNLTASSETNILLTKRPNIYVFFIESFHDIEQQKKIYNIDTSKLEEYLAENKFSIYSIYSNSIATLLSASDFFAMKKYIKASKGSFDVVPSTRRLIGGDYSNTLLRILKANGYRTSFIADTGTDFFTEQGQLLDDTDLAPSQNSALLLRPLADLHPRLARLLEDFSAKNKNTGLQSDYSGDLHQRLERAIHLSQEYGQPYFIFYYGGAGHTPTNPDEYSYKKRETWIAEYNKLMEHAYDQIFGTVDLIIREDQEALIVLIGDHGTLRLRGILDSSDITVIRALMEEEGISEKELTDDFHGVFLGLRIPGIEGDISRGRPLSHVNLFRYIFAALNNDPSILDNCVQTISLYFDWFLLAKDGRPCLEKYDERH